MDAEPSVTLDSGLRALIRPDRFVPGAYELVVDGTPQSHVNLDDPTELFFEYVSRMGHVIDRLKQPGEPLTALHLGAGGLTIPRYVEATRPGSRQQVIELEPKLVELVRGALPLPRGASIRVRYGDARTTLEKLPGGLRGTVDLLVVDVFGGALTPPQVTSREFYAAGAAFLAPDGVMLVNIADGGLSGSPNAAFARSQAATLLDVFGAPERVAVLAEPQVIRSRRFGNFVLVGSARELPEEWMGRILAGGPHPAGLLTGVDLRDWTAGAPVTTDDNAQGSPDPNRSIFTRRLGG
ncbi:spermidine synthase [Pseudolysinimonas sp.]|uniref:spermidine synthase n=1 Tax=Pseudolysinimonas sp. TaxID=2680009 RepID=UPI003F819D36